MIAFIVYLTVLFIENIQYISSIEIFLEKAIISYGSSPIFCIIRELFCHNLLSLIGFTLFVFLIVKLFFEDKLLFIEEQPWHFIARKKEKIINKPNCIAKHKGNPTRAFLKRDLRYAFKNKLYIIMQFVFLIIGIYIAVTFENISLNLNFFITLIICWFNALLVQNLFIIDSYYSKWYKMLPLKYMTFIVTRLLSTVIFSLISPLMIILLEVLLQKLSFINFTVLIIAMIVWVIFLSLYYSSIIMFFFPKVRHKTDIPLFVGIFLMFLPIIPIGVIVIGLYKGSRKWRLW
jgi:hypothetical protein